MRSVISWIGMFRLSQVYKHLLAPRMNESKENGDITEHLDNECHEKIRRTLAPQANEPRSIAIIEPSFS